jgi:aspartyl-tRNA(Asn)/glutamyl-tRNA(Gln) amidotransferase subunit C
MDPEQIAALARLARLELSAAEQARAADQLERLLAHFEALAAVPTDGVEPSPYPRPIRLRMRQDEPGATLSAADVLANAPARRAGQFLVPKVIDA